jgi:hypothetical protein
MAHIQAIWGWGEGSIHLMLLVIWRAVISSDMGLVYCARAVRSQSSDLLAIEYPRCPNKYHSGTRGGWLRKTGVVDLTAYVGCKSHDPAKHLAVGHLKTRTGFRHHHHATRRAIFNLAYDGTIFNGLLFVFIRGVIYIYIYIYI